MASKTIQICDNCGAQFDMSEDRWKTAPASKRHPLYPCNVTIGLGFASGTIDIQKMVCEPCRDKFEIMVREFFS